MSKASAFSTFQEINSQADRMRLSLGNTWALLSRVNFGTKETCVASGVATSAGFK